MRNEKYLIELRDNPELASKEYAKCIDSKEYFYNTWCKKEGDPDYSPEAFEEYQKSTENKRGLYLTKFRRSGPKAKIGHIERFYKNYPLNAAEVFKPTNNKL